MIQESYNPTVQLSDLKKELKEYEKNYLAKHGKLPEKKELQENKEMENKYKLYYKLKKTMVTKTPDRRISIRNSSNGGMKTPKSVPNKMKEFENNTSPKNVDTYTPMKRYISDISMDGFEQDQETHIENKYISIQPPNMTTNQNEPIKGNVSTRTTINLKDFRKNFGGNNLFRASSIDNSNPSNNDTFSDEDMAKIDLNEITDGTDKKNKKATMKRQTKRIKLKPLDRIVKKKIQNKPQTGEHKGIMMVSQNFTRLNLRGKKKNYGASDRRRDFYKKMTRKHDAKESIQERNAAESDLRNNNEKMDFSFDGRPYEIEIEGENVARESSANNATIKDSNLSLLQLRELLVPKNTPGEILLSVSTSYWEKYMNEKNDLLLGMQGDVNGNVVVNIRELVNEIWGYKEIWKIQLDAIKRILNCQSTLVVMGLTKGESFVYKLCSLVLLLLTKPFEIDLVSFVASSKKATFDHHIKNLPKILNGYSLPAKNWGYPQGTISDLESGKINILYLSVNQLLSFPDNSGLKVSFVVIQNAHCTSLNSVDYKPSYMLAGKKIKDSIKPSCVLATTKVCNEELAEELCYMSGLDPERAIVGKFDMVNPEMRYNIARVRQGQKDLELVELVTKLFTGNNKILIYTSNKKETERLVSVLMTNDIRSLTVYHNEMHYTNKLSTNENIKKGNYKIVLATVDSHPYLSTLSVSITIHYTLPRTVEEYLIQVSRCNNMHKTNAFSYNNKLLSIILVEDGCDEFAKKKGRVISSRLDKVAIKQFFNFLIDKVNEQNGKLKETLSNRVVAIETLENTQKKLDLNEYEIEDLIACFALLRPDQFSYLSKNYKRASIAFTKSRHHSSLGSLFCKSFVSSQNSVDIESVSNEYMLIPNEIYRKLSIHQQIHNDCVISYSESSVYMLLKSNSNEPNGNLVMDASFKENVRDDLVDEFIDLVCSYYQTVSKTLTKKISSWESILVAGRCENGGESFSEIYDGCERESHKFMERINLYFNEKMDENSSLKLCSQGSFDLSQTKFPPTETKISSINSTFVDDGVFGKLKSFVDQHYSRFSNGKSIARIFHGISTPKYSAIEWGWTDCWNKFSYIDFESLAETAHKLLIETNL
ncbi:hypothetical protein BB558_005274 [Smittium angustum]|uniref:DNA 3'-5' helicase n=1 Tax=Smittium angustum TaxID=133377 RepID=A0A2U1J183_SMIAN|nr:hypothetical protein BB558_005274 [Smittium angustum]